MMVFLILIPVEDPRTVLPAPPIIIGPSLAEVSGGFSYLISIFQTLLLVHPANLELCWSYGWRIGAFPPSLPSSLSADADLSVVSTLEVVTSSLLSADLDLGGVSTLGVVTSPLLSADLDLGGVS